MRIRLRVASARTSLGAAALSLGLLVAPLPIGAVSQTPAPADVARSLQKRYAGIRDFRADFTQTASGGVLRMVKSEQRGEVKIKKPGRMRWTYTAPEKKEFVSDGATLYSYMPADRQVIVSDVPAGGGDTTAALFLAGRGDLTKDFTAALEGQDANLYRLTLTPKKKQQDFDTLVLHVRRGSLQIAALVARDRQGGTSTFTFTNLKENVGLADSRFVFKTPRGVQVVRAGD